MYTPGKRVGRAPYTSNKRYRGGATKTSSRSRKVTKYAPRLLASPVDFGRRSLPLRIKNVMRYSTTFEVTIDVGGTALASIRANGLYDPEPGLGGHQPLYFDQLMALYNHYAVVKSRMKATVVGLTGIGGTCQVTQFIDDDSSPTTTALAIRERIGAKTRMYTTSQTDTPGWTFFNAQAAFGGNVIDNDELHGDVVSDPVEQQVFHVYLSQGTPTNTFQINIEVEYDTVWSELKSITAS